MLKGSSGSMVAYCKWSLHWHLVLEVPGSIPFGSEENLVVRSCFCSCYLQYDMNVRCPSDWNDNWRLPLQGQSSPVQVKELYTGSILMHVGSSCKHTRVYNVHLPRIIRY